MKSHEMTTMKRRWNLVTPYEYLFYWVYAGQGKIPKDTGREKQRQVAFMVTCLFVFINACTLFICFQIISGKEILFENTYTLLPIAVIALINYFIFSYEKETIPSLIARFGSQSEADRKRRGRFCWIYAITTSLAFFGALMVQSWVFPK
jgi:hypothetical protein